MTRARRALLYMPGDDERKIRKSLSLDVDCICMDLEDGVAILHKDKARILVKDALMRFDFGHAERLVRINQIGSGLEFDDLDCVLQAKPDGIVIPKVETAAQIKYVSQKIGEYENRIGLTKGFITIIAIVETAKGILNLSEISIADSRLDALVFGAEDLAGDIGATRTTEGKEILYPRSMVILHAAAQGLQAIDMVFVDYQNQEGLKREALEGARMGFVGKQIIHPNQVKVVQDAYTPTDETIRFAEQLIAEYDKYQASGIGAFSYNGKMVDAPMIRNAQSILDKARLAGKI
jgi:citrate lyase subunit beta-like protein